MRFTGLNKINMSHRYFFKYVMRQNLKISNEKKYFDSRIFNYNIGLAEFGNFLYSRRNYENYNIYYSEYYDDDKIFYLADETGLISAFIFGPNLQKEKDWLSIENLTNQVYYGFNIENKYKNYQKNTFLYSCIEDFNNEKNEPLKIVDLDEVQRKYLPLPSDIINRTNNYFYYSYDSIIRGTKKDNIIFKSDKRSFFLPLEELISPLINKKDGIIKVRGEIKEKHILINATEKTFGRRDTFTDYWSGKVSYEKFEILELDKTSNNSDRRW